jgi:hypothetical protein
MATFYRLDWQEQSVQGQALPGVQIYVCTQPASTGSVPPSPLATLFADSAGVTPLSQPLNTDGFGETFAYMASGLYTVVVVINGAVTSVYPDQTVGVLTSGIVTSNEGNLAVNSVIMGNGGTDIVSGSVLSGNLTDYFSGLGTFVSLLLPATKAPVSSQWLKSYNSTTGLFTTSQPAYSDIFGPPQLPVANAGSSHQFFTAYNDTTGVFSTGQPSFADITGTATSGQYVVMIGDSGSGGTQGAVPAPPSGSAAAMKFLKADGTWAVPAGSGIGLSSVGLSTTAAWFTIGNSPLIANGTITINPTTGLTANQVLATPNGSTGAVGLRSLVAADIPNLAASILTSGQVALAQGGTNVNLSAQGGVVNTTGKFVLKQDGSHIVTSAALIVADLPSLPASQITSGQLALAQGGTNADLSASGSSTAFLAQSAGHTISARSIVDADLPSLTFTLSYVIDGGGSSPLAGAYGQLTIPFAFTITGVYLTSDVSGSCVLDIKTCANGSFPGSLTSITASDKPTLSSSQFSADTTLTGWTTSVSSNSQLQFLVSSASTLTRINVTLVCTRSYS